MLQAKIWCQRIFKLTIASVKSSALASKSHSNWLKIGDRTMHNHIHWICTECKVSHNKPIGKWLCYVRACLYKWWYGVRVRGLNSYFTLPLRAYIIAYVSSHTWRRDCKCVWWVIWADIGVTKKSTNTTLGVMNTANIFSTSYWFPYEHLNYMLLSTLCCYCSYRTSYIFEGLRSCVTLM